MIDCCSPINQGLNLLPHTRVVAVDGIIANAYIISNADPSVID